MALVLSWADEIAHQFVDGGEHRQVLQLEDKNGSKCCTEIAGVAVAFSTASTSFTG